MLVSLVPGVGMKGGHGVLPPEPDLARSTQYGKHPRVWHPYLDEPYVPPFVILFLWIVKDWFSD